MSKSAAFKAACLGASLATAWSASKAEAAGDFKVTADTTISGLSQLTLFSGDLIIPIPNESDGISALRGGGSHWAGTILLAAPDNLASQPWEMIGLGTGAQANDVVVVFGNPSGAIDQPFSVVFSGADEAAVVDKIRRGTSQDARDLEALLASVGATAEKFGGAGTAVQFSNGVNIGTVTVSIAAVPEPSSVALGAFGFAAMFGRVLRRR